MLIMRLFLNSGSRQCTAEDVQKCENNLNKMDSIRIKEMQPNPTAYNDEFNNTYIASLKNITQIVCIVIFPRPDKKQSCRTHRKSFLLISTIKFSTF